MACKANGQGAMDPSKIAGAVITGNNTFTYHNAECFQITIPEKLGSAQAIYYDVKALATCCKIIEKIKEINQDGNNNQNKNNKTGQEEEIKTFVVYVMACRIGPFFGKYVKNIHKLGGKVYLNPDGHEWKRTKWNKFIRAYWKKSEEMMVKKSDLVICDSVNIEKYIKESYDSPDKKINTTYIAYGAETRKSIGAEERYEKWLKQKGLRRKGYYLVVGRFVPENNYETMIREFLKSKSKKDFAIITNTNDEFLEKLEKRLGFRKDNRIKFVGTVYDQELLMKIREEAYGYFHGHEVGGTNPSLLEALSSTKLNLLLGVEFNKEVAEDAAFYWSKKDGDLARLIDKADEMSKDEIAKMGKKAKKRIQTVYNWKFICGRYAEEFLRQ